MGSCVSKKRIPKEEVVLHECRISSPDRYTKRFNSVTLYSCHTYFSRRINDDFLHEKVLHECHIDKKSDDNNISGSQILTFIHEQNIHHDE
jgi:hypothetical protein